MNPVPRSATRGHWSALPLLFLSSVASAQGGTSLGFDSAVDSHRRLGDDSASITREAEVGDDTSRDDSRVEPDDVAGSPGQERGAKPAGDRPMPLDPAQAMAPDENGRTSTPSMRDSSLQYDSTLADYERFERSDAPAWVEANERVGEIGGWREYAKELYAPAPEPVAPETETETETETGTETGTETETGTGTGTGAAGALPAEAAKPAGERPMPLDPAGAMAPQESGLPAEPSMPKATLEYDSAFASYVPYEESEGPAWIEANERVGEIGGWREYAKELYEPSGATADDGEER